MSSSAATASTRSWAATARIRSRRPTTPTPTSTSAATDRHHRLFGLPDAGQRHDGNDVLLGGSGDDALFGGWGADRLDGGAASDECHGDQDVDGSANCEVQFEIPQSRREAEPRERPAPPSPPTE
jgi:Ca2+-binding RTX toxin-like protein